MSTEDVSVQIIEQKLRNIPQDVFLGMKNTVHVEKRLSYVRIPRFQPIPVKSIDYNYDVPGPWVSIDTIKLHLFRWKQGIELWIGYDTIDDKWYYHR